jgi:predicted nucleotidyltransferase component of viral defense system
METIRSFSRFLSSQTKDFALKGGTALAVCYGSDMLSDDIGLDAKFPEAVIEPRVKKFSEASSYSFRAAKNTDTVKRLMISCGRTGHPLTIEESFRQKAVAENKSAEINGIAVYTIDGLCAQKNHRLIRPRQNPRRLRSGLYMQALVGQPF